MTIYSFDMFDHFQFTFIRGPNIPGSNEILFFTAPDFTLTTRHIHNWALFPLRFSLFFPSGAISPFFSSSVLGTYWPGSSSFSVLSFCLFILFMGFSRQECCSGLPLPSPADQVLSELSTVIHLYWVIRHSTAHSFTELDTVVIHVVSLVSLLWLCFSICLPFDGSG